MLIDYNLLRSFVEVVHASSFSEAAKRRGITASAISHQIKTLEGQLGFPLFERVGRRSKPTQAAMGLLDKVAPEFRNIDDALHGTRTNRDDIRGRVRVGGPGPFYQFWLRPRIRKLLEHHPQLELEVAFGDAGLIEDQLLQGELDISLYFGHRESGALEKAQVYEEEIVAVASPDYFAQHGTPKTPEELREHAYLGNSLRMIGPWWGTLYGHLGPPPQRNRCDVEEVRETLALTKRGLGIAIVPTFALGDALETGELERVSLENAETSYRKPIWIAWRKGTDETARLQAVRKAFLDASVSAKR